MRSALGRGPTAVAASTIARAGRADPKGNHETAQSDSAIGVGCDAPPEHPRPELATGPLDSPAPILLKTSWAKPERRRDEPGFFREEQVRKLLAEAVGKLGTVEISISDVGLQPDALFTRNDPSSATTPHGVKPAGPSPESDSRRDERIEPIAGGTLQHEDRELGS